MIDPTYTTAGRRRRKVRTVQGELMVTPTKPVTLTIDGRREALRPGRDRFAVEHEVVRQRPELFRVADPRDRLTASELRVMVARAQSRPDTRGPGPRTASRQPPWSLDVSHTPSRLPRRQTGRRPWTL